MSKIEAKNFSKSKNYKYQSEKCLGKLAEARIIQKHLVYVIGLSSSLANSEVSPNLYRHSQNKNILDNMELLIKL
jgi:hypothetical protein